MLNINTITVESIEIYMFLPLFEYFYLNNPIK